MKIRNEKIHSYYAADDNGDNIPEENSDSEIEEENCNKTIEIVKNFNEKCVKFLEQPSVYAFRQSGKQYL